MGLFDFLDPIQKVIEDWLFEQGFSVTPYDTIFLLAVSVIVSSISGGITRLLIDMDELGEQNDKIQEHNKRKKKAQETADKKLWLSVQKKEKDVMDLQRQMMTKRMLPSLITMGPIIFVFNTLRETFQRDENLAYNATYETCLVEAGDGLGSCGVVAVLPFDVPSWFPLIGGWFSDFAGDTALDVAGFGFWYFLTAITSSTLIQKIFGINLTGMQQPGMGR